MMSGPTNELQFISLDETMPYLRALPDIGISMQEANDEVADDTCRFAVNC